MFYSISWKVVKYEILYEMWNVESGIWNETNSLVNLEKVFNVKNVLLELGYIAAGAHGIHGIS